jgi:hypothetical protein
MADMVEKSLKRSWKRAALPLLLLLCLGAAALGAQVLQPVLQGMGSETKYTEDINCDGTVNLADALALLRLGMAHPDTSAADFDKDGGFDLQDLLVLLMHIRDKVLTPVIIKPVTFTVSGRINDGKIGLAGAAVRIRGNGVDTSLTTNPIGMFMLTGLSNGAYIARPQKLNYTFIPDSTVFNVQGDSVMLPVFNATLHTFVIVGKVLEDTLGVGLVAVNVKGSGVDTTYYTDFEGKFRVQNLVNGVYVLRLSKKDYAFTPDSLVVTMNSASVIVPNVKATSTAPPLVGFHQIEGKIYCTSGPIPNVKVILKGAKEFETLTNESGSYYFMVQDGIYTVIPFATTGIGFSPALYENIKMQGYDIVSLNFYSYLSENLPPTQ